MSSLSGSNIGSTPTTLLFWSDGFSETENEKAPANAEALIGTASKIEFWGCIKINNPAS